MGGRTLNRFSVRITVLGALVALAAAATASADPGPTLARFLDPDPGFLSELRLPPLRTGGHFISLAQETGTEWGWENDVKKGKIPGKGSELHEGVETIKEKKPPEPPRGSDKPREGTETTARAADGSDAGPLGGTVWAKKTRIGVGFGGLLPFGEKEESFDTGFLGGVHLGFGLPSLIGGLTVTMEVRLLGGTTSSTGQTDGFDVSAIVFMAKDDLLFHFFPRQKSFNIYYFLGLSLGYESTSAKRTLAGGGTESKSDTALWFLVDTGFGAWIGLADAVDLVLKFEFNLVPVTENVPFFVVGEAGVQVKF
jgi:hypothetical protein